jgi:methionine-rich copper-binding protein CopC
MNVRLRLHAFAVAMCCCAAAGDALPHAIILEAQPAMNSTVAPGDVELRLRFNSKIDVARSNLRLGRPDGTMAPIALGSDGQKGEIGGHASATLEGRWTLHWQVLSLDGHITRGDVIFFVRR